MMNKFLESDEVLQVMQRLGEMLAEVEASLIVTQDDNGDPILFLMDSDEAYDLVEDAREGVYQDVRSTH